MKYIPVITLLFTSHLVLAQEEQLIIFTQSTDLLFINETLPQIKAFATSENIQFFEQNALDGLPNKITSTPAIVYRNGNGVSTYAGRYTSMTTIKNFVRSARVSPQKSTTLDKKNILVTNQGQMQIAASIKITDAQFLDSTEETDYDSSQFLKLAHSGIQKGLKNYNLKELVQLERTDRIFYLDYHPYFVNKDSVILSVELYSQFSCIDPIYKSIDQIITGSDVEVVFSKATALLNNEIFKSLSSSNIGDAYSPVRTNNLTKELNDFNVPTPTKSKSSYATVDPNRVMPNKWTFKSSVNSKLPILQFNFMEPLTRYAGEIKTIDGNIELSKVGALMSGLFIASMKSLTMGEDSFDKKVLKEYVKAKSNPKSEFKVDKIINPEPLKWLETTTMTIKGNMTLMKKSRSITVTTNITPYVDTLGYEVLLVQANWSMNITDGWKINGPDGPDPAKKILEFSMNILMQPIK